MCALNLDLVGARAKVARAREHYELLSREARAVFDKGLCHSVRVGDVDPESGWCSVYVTPPDASQPRLGVLVGDLVHNLRSALDYTVVSLVHASHARITDHHQFPIFDSPEAYARCVYAKGGPPALRENGPLEGITVGADLIEQLQPYHNQPDPHADRLWHIYRLSNADKHREITAFAPRLGKSRIGVEHDGVILEDMTVEVPSDGQPHREYEAVRIRFTLPGPSLLRCETKLSIQPLFSTGPRPGKVDLHMIGIELLTESCDHVATILDRFEAL